MAFQGSQHTTREIAMHFKNYLHVVGAVNNKLDCRCISQAVITPFILFPIHVLTISRPGLQETEDY